MKKILFLLFAICSLSIKVHSDIMWSAPAAISTPLTNAADPHVVIDSSGNSSAVWVENNIIKASSLGATGLSWSVPVPISNVLNTSASPRVAVDGSGNVTALWVENTQIESATFSGGIWSLETAPISGTGASNPSFDVDANGNAVAVWVRGGIIESSTRTAGSWSLVSQLSTTASSNPHVAISSFGTALVAWHSVSSGSDVIMSNMLTVNSNTWGKTNKTVVTALAGFSHNFPKVSIDANGNANVHWFRYNLVNGNAYENVQVRASSLSQGASAWSLPSVLSNRGIRNPADLMIKTKFDVNGNALAVWTQSFDGETFVIEASQLLNGAASWSSAIDPWSSLYSFAYDLSIAGNTALLASMSWDGVSTLFIQSQEADTTIPNGLGFTVNEVFSTGSDNAYPSCSMTLSGNILNAVVVWIGFNGTNTVINASSGTDTGISPPGNVSAAQSSTNFGVYTDYSNTVTWTASSDPNLVQYNIYRNGVFFTATSPGTLSVVDHNQVNGGAVTYGVAALDVNFRQSPIISFTLF